VKVTIGLVYRLVLGGSLNQVLLPYFGRFSKACTLQNNMFIGNPKNFSIACSVVYKGNISFSFHL
jgi:hypothetical protein